MPRIFLLWMVFTLFVCAQNREIYVSIKKQQQQIFWEWTVKDHFPQKKGFVYTKVIFSGGEVTNSRKRIRLKNGEFSLIHGPVQGQVLSGNYELHVSYVNKNIRKNYVYKHFYGTLYEYKKQQMHYIDFFTDFAIKVALFNEHILSGKPSRQQLALDIHTDLVSELENLSPPHIFIPHFKREILYANHIVLGQKKMMSCDKAQIQTFVQNSHHYLAQIKNIFVDPQQFDQKIVEKDLKWCEEIVGALDDFLHKSPTKTSELEYFFLEIEHLQKRQTQYEKSLFCQSEIAKHFAQMREHLLLLIKLQFRLFHNKNNIPLPETIKNVEDIEITEVKRRFVETKKNIKEYLHAKEKQRLQKIENSKKDYLRIYKEYKTIKKQVLQRKKSHHLSSLQQKFTQIQLLPKANTTFAQMVYFLNKIDKLLHKNDKLSTYYIAKYKLYLQDLEQNLEKQINPISEKNN